MAEPRVPRTPPSEPDGDGVRVVSKPRRSLRASPGLGAVAIVAVAAIAWLVSAQRATQVVDREAAQVAVDNPSRVTPERLPSSRPARRTAAAQDPAAMPSNDPNDLAAYFRPGDPEPTGAELITALHESGVRTGIGAFNPPGTSPPLEGLAVPVDFPLPNGYARHHQVTDEGVPIEPILMFAPGFTLHDAQGRLVALPANRVVPPGLAPPGFPLRWVRPGTH